MNKLVFSILTILSSATFAGLGASSGGGLPSRIQQVTYTYNCQAELGIYLIKGKSDEQKHYGVFTQDFTKKSVAGEIVSDFGRDGYSMDNSQWKLDKSKSQNSNLEVFKKYMTNPGELNIDQSGSADYSKTDVVSVTLWLGGEGETFVTRSLHLADQDFDIEVTDKVRNKDFYSSHSLKVTCQKAQ